MSRFELARRTAGIRGTTLVAVGVYLLAFLAWLALIRRWLPTPTTGEMQMSRPGVPEQMAASSGVEGWVFYLLMWGVMMVAMMYPSSVPLVRLYYRTLDGVSTRGKAARVGAFLGTYALVWTATGVIPLVVNNVVPITAVADSTVPFAGVLLVLAGYQLSPYKDRCLRHCRSPLGFLMTHHEPGVRGAVRTSYSHSLYCVGCCWALFAFMVVVGTMSLVWMAAITLVLSVERTVSWGETLGKGVGVLAGVAGVALLVGTVV